MCIRDRYEGWLDRMWEDASGIMTWMGQSAYPSMAVSYTHLDVYKRQRCANPMLEISDEIETLNWQGIFDQNNFNPLRLSLIHI